MQLEDQLSALAELGLTLDPGITLDDVLYSFGRESYESRPFSLLFFILGSEVERAPWGRNFCSRVWNFDTECVEGSGAYVRIVRRLCEVAGASHRLGDVTDHVDLGSGEAWLKYTLDGQPRHWEVEVSDDWADGMVVSYVLDDIESDGRRFYSMDNGQAAIIAYLTDDQASRLNELSSEQIRPMLPD